MKGLYFLLLSTFVARVAWAALPYDTGLVNWYIFSDQTATAQFAFWRLMTLLIDASLIYAMIGISFKTEAHERYQYYKMAKLLLLIQVWYILEYCVHYTSIWLTWEQLGFIGDGKSGLSSHIITMSIFAYFGYD